MKSSTILGLAAGCFAFIGGLLAAPIIANAADYSTFRPAPVMAPPVATSSDIWTGLHVTALAGYIKDTETTVFNVDPQLVASGFVSGAGIGFDYKVGNSPFVVGLNADYMHLGLKGSMTTKWSDQTYHYSLGDTFNAGSLFTFMLDGGVLLNDWLKVYAGGGAVVVLGSHNRTLTTWNQNGTWVDTGNITYANFGWGLKAGVEAKLDKKGHWSAKLEGIYGDTGKTSLFIKNSEDYVTGGSAKNNFWLVRAGLSYRF